MTTEKKEEYIEAIFKAQGEDEGVKTKILAQKLNITPASVTDMIKKLETEGLVEKDQKKIALTAKGEKEALKIIRKHRLAERFFVDALHLNWDEVHEDACKFEHILNDKIADALDKFLSCPKTCPHGNPIPSKDGKIATPNLKPLSDLKVNTEAIVRKITEESREFLHYLSCLGIIPPEKIKVVQIAPFNGPFLVEIRGTNYAIGRDVGKKIWVEPIKSN